MQENITIKPDPECVELALAGLRLNEQHLHQILTNLPVVVFALDLDGIFTLSEGKGLNLLGLEPGEVVGQSVFAVYRTLPEVLLTVRRAMNGESVKLEVDITTTVFEVWLDPLKDKRGGIVGVLGLAVDITERARAAQTLRNDEEHYRYLVEHQSEGLLMMDDQMRFTYTNLAAQAILGYSESDLIGHGVLEFFAEETHVYLQERVAQRRLGKTESYEVGFTRPDGQLIHLLVTSTPRFDANGHFAGNFIVFRDISERVAIEQRLRYQSTHDALTGLYNRNHWDETLHQIETNRQQFVSVVVMDVDGLKEVNDRYGHLAGDRLLRQAARVLRGVFRSEDILARFGGDEFVALVSNLDENRLDDIMSRLRQAIIATSPQDGLPSLQMSIGGAVALPNESVLDCLALADQRMYAEKQKYKRKI